MANRVIRCIMAPFRALNRVRNLYVSSMMGCAKSSAGMASVMPRSRSRGFPSSTATSSDDDIRDLIRLASRGSTSAGRSKDVGVVPRSQSVAVGIGRIDEDRPCTFEGDAMAGLDAVMYPRSRSCAVGGERRVRVLA